MTINPRDKGKAFEYEIRDSLKYLDPKVRRSIMSGAIGSSIQSEEGDISNSIGLCIECKRTEKLKPYEFYDQAVSNNTSPGRIPVVVMKSNRREILALVSWSDFLRMYERYMQSGGVYKAKISKKDQTRKPEKIQSDKLKRIRELREKKFS